MIKTMEKQLHAHHISFKHAWEGLVWAAQTQPNFRVHIVLALLAFFLCWFLDVTSLEFLIILFTVVLGLSAEMINTALESITDLVTTEWRSQAKIAKDVSAGMMLVVALGAIIVAAVIFGPKIITL